MRPGFQEPPNAGPVQLFLSLSNSLAFCACEERVFLSVLFSLLFSSSFCRRLRRVRRSLPARNFPPATVRSIFSLRFFLLGSSSSSWSSWSRERSIQSCDRKERKKERDTAVQDFCLFFSPSFPLPCGSIYLSTISSIRLFCQSQIFAHFHGNHRLPGCFLLLS